MKEEKNIDMDKAPTLTRSTTQREKRFTFPIPPRTILEDLIKKGLLRPLDRRHKMIVWTSKIIISIVYTTKKDIVQ